MELSSYTWLIFLLLISPVKGEDSKNSNEWCWSDYAIGAVVGVGAVAAAPFVLSAAGFGATGVAAGSMAAGAQSTFYGAAVASGSAFAALQSAGAAGIGVIGNALIGATAGGASLYVKKKFAPCNEGPSSSCKFAPCNERPSSSCKYAPCNEGPSSSCNEE